MNKANQKALVQATNIGLIQIRNSEISYYANIYISFGTQSALIGGFTYNVFTIPRLGYGDVTDTVLLDLYWISSCLTILFSVHVIVNCMMLQVVGPGLALNGPVGSMARATEGMKAELNQILSAFVAMMISFAVSTTLSYWVVLDFVSAIITTFVSIVAGYYWYYYCERIYLRFYWRRESIAGWERDGDDRPSDILPTDKIPTNIPTNRNQMNSIAEESSSNYGADGNKYAESVVESTDSFESKRRKKLKSSRVSRFFSRFPSKNLCPEMTRLIKK